MFDNNTVFKKIITGNHSRGHFVEQDPGQLLKWITEYGSPTVIFHSHPCEATPSAMDLEYMRNTIPFFGCVWLIMSNKMKLRAWTLREITLILNEIRVEIV